MKDKVIDAKKLNTQLKDDMTIMFGGFMAIGTSNVLINAICESGIKNITAICNDAGREGQGLGKLIQNGQVKKLYASHIGLNHLLERR